MSVGRRQVLQLNFMLDFIEFYVFHPEVLVKQYKD